MLSELVDAALKLPARSVAAPTGMLTKTVPLPAMPVTEMV